MKTALKIWVCFGFFIMLTHSSFAEDKPEAVIKYRQNVMKSIGGHMGAMSTLMKENLSFHAHLSIHAKAMASTGSTIQDLFPQGTSEGETNSKKEVWESMEKFEKATKNFQNEANKLVEVAEKKDVAEFGTQLLALGKTCKACHDDFRKEVKK